MQGRAMPEPMSARVALLGKLLPCPPPRLLTGGGGWAVGKSVPLMGLGLLIRKVGVISAQC